MIKSDMDQRIQSCEDTRRSNCIGTALYIAGIAKEDKLVSPPESSLTAYIKRLRRPMATEFKELRKIDTPQTGALVVWELEFGTAVHAGVFILEEPLQIAHRLAMKGLFEARRDFREVNSEYSELFCGEINPRFYLPIFRE